MNFRWTLVGYEKEDFSKLWSNIIRWIGLWAFVFPQEEFFVYIVMLTQDEYGKMHPMPYSATYDQSGRWLIFNNKYPYYGDNRPGCTGQPLTEYPPSLLWHEMGEWFGSMVLDYDTEHYDSRAHCDTPIEPIAGMCPQLAPNNNISSHCVKCRAAMQRTTGLKVNILQTAGEYRWMAENFGWRQNPRPYTDLCAQMADWEHYNYAKYPIGFDLGQYVDQGIEEPKRKIHFYLERVLGGDGMPARILTFEHPEIVFDPLTVSVKKRGFRSVVPDVAVAGEEVTISVWEMVDTVKVPVSGVRVFLDGEEVGYTNEDGELSIKV